MVQVATRSFKLAADQQAFTKEVNKKSEGLESIKAEMQKQQDDFLKLILAEMQNPSLDGDSHQDLVGPLAALEGAKAIAMQTEATLESTYAMKQSAMIQKSAMCGKTVHVDDSTRSFAGQDVTYNFDLVGKNVPEKAVMQGSILIKDEDGQIIYRRNLNKVILGKNEFVWDGKGKDGKQVKHGSYKIEVDAHYTVRGSDKKTTLTVNMERDSVIDKVNIKTGDLISNGQKIDMESKSDVFMSGTKAFSEVEDDGFHERDYTSYIDKTVFIEQDEIKYSGKDKTPVSFFSDLEQKDSNVEIYFAQNGRHVSMAKTLMDLEKGQNNFPWNGLKTETADDIQKVKDRKAVFPQLPNGTYTYQVFVTTKDGIREKLETGRTITVDGIDTDGGKTYIVAQDGNRFDVNTIRNITKSKTTAVKTVEDVQKETALYAGKRVKVADDVIIYTGSKVEIPFTIATSVLGNDKQVGKISTIILDKEGAKIREVKMEAADAHAKVNILKQRFNALDDDSQAKLNWWIGEKGWLGEDNYKDAIKDHKADIDQIIQDHLDDLHLRTDVTISLPQIWDGKDGLGQTVANGTYTYVLKWDAEKLDGAHISTITEDLDIVLPISRAAVEDGKTILTLQDGRRVKLEDVQAWVS